MSKLGLAGKAQTVLGPIPAEDLGVTLPHEHLLISNPRIFVEPSAATEKVLAYQPVTLENLHWVRYHPVNNLDNLVLMDEEVAIKEALDYRRVGGNTIVELTNSGLGRDPLGLRRIVLATGLNIVMGAGYYIASTHPAYVAKKTDVELAEDIARDFTVGVDGTGVCAGIIGEVGCTWPLENNERKVLRASALAQQRTGAPLNIHPGRNPKAPFEIVDILRDAGADISRTVMSHIDRTIRDFGDILKLAETGCYIEYDLFGLEGYYPLAQAMVDLPNDAQRVKEIMGLIAEGYGNKILISQDIITKMNLHCFGGHGYTHIIERVLPLMRSKGMTDEDIGTIIVENPRRMLQFM